jgi:hypothetical protein
MPLDQEPQESGEPRVAGKTGARKYLLQLVSNRLPVDLPGPHKP